MQQGAADGASGKGLFTQRVNKWPKEETNMVTSSCDAWEPRAPGNHIKGRGPKEREPVTEGGAERREASRVCVPLLSCRVHRPSSLPPSELSRVGIWFQGTCSAVLGPDWEPAAEFQRPPVLCGWSPREVQWISPSLEPASPLCFSLPDGLWLRDVIGSWGPKGPCSVCSLPFGTQVPPGRGKNRGERGPTTLTEAPDSGASLASAVPAAPAQSSPDHQPQIIGRQVLVSSPCTWERFPVQQGKVVPSLCPDCGNN